MLYVAIVLFLVAAVLGGIVAYAIMAGRPTPKLAVYLHGALAAAGLGITAWYAIQHPEKYPLVSIAILAIAALGGFVLFARDMMKKPGPLALVIIHALAAVGGVAALLVFAIQ
jgi:hypothetical protein